jgi:hypothetical protein
MARRFKIGDKVVSLITNRISVIKNFSWEGDDAYIIEVPSDDGKTWSWYGHDQQVRPATTEELVYYALTKDRFLGSLRSGSNRS